MQAFVLLVLSRTAPNILEARAVPFKSDTYVPITAKNIWAQGEDLTVILRKNKDRFFELVKSGKRGRFVPNAIRLGVRFAPKHTLYVDKFGGVRLDGRDTRLSKRQFEALGALVPRHRSNVKRPTKWNTLPLP